MVLRIGHSCLSKRLRNDLERCIEIQNESAPRKSRALGNLDEHPNAEVDAVGACLSPVAPRLELWR